MAGFDDIKDKGLISSRGMDLLRTRQERMQTKSVQEVRVIEKITQDTKEIDRLTKTIDENFNEKLEHISRLSSRVEEYKKLLAQLEKARMFGADKQFKSSMRTAMSSSSMADDIRRFQNAPSTFSSALEVAKGMSTAEIQAELERNRRLATRQSSRIAETSQDLEGSEAKLENQLKARDRALQQAGIYQAALHTQKKLGIDMESRYYNAYNVTQDAIRSQQQMDIRGKVSAGEFGTRGKVEEELNQATQRLIATFEKLNTVTDKSSKEASELANEFDKAEKEVAHHKQVLSEMDRQSRQGGGGMGGIGAYLAMSLIGNIGTLGVAGANIYRHTAITSELSKMGNQIGFAQIQNQRFQDTVDSTRGNMGALRRVLTNQAGLETDFALQMGERESTAAGVQAAGQVGRGIGALKDALIPTRDLGRTVGRWIGGGTEAGAMGVAANHFVGAGAQAAPEIGKAAADITDYLKGIPQAQTAQQSAQLFRQLQDTLNQIDDTTSQRARDFTFNTGMATRGIGRGRQRVLGGLTNVGNRMDLAERTGLTDEEISSLTRSGVSELGVQFSGLGDVRRAGELSRAGFFQDPGQMLQARGMLTGAGGGQKDLETIMKNAVANGMDSSKNIMEMVQGIGSISNRSAQAGIGTVAGTTEMMGRTLDSLRATGMSPNMAGGVAMRSAEIAGSISADKGLNIFNAIEFAELQQQFPDAKPWELQRLADMTPEQVQELVGAFESGDQDKIRTARIQSGASQITNLEQAKALQGVNRRQVLTTLTGAPGIDQGMQQTINEKIERGESLSDEEQMFINARGVSRFGASGVGVAGTVSTGRSRQGGLGGAAGGLVASVEADKTAAAISDAKLFADGAARIEKAAGSFENLGKTMEQVARMLDPGKMAAATKAAAEEGSFTVGQFSDKVKPFNNAVDQIITGLGELEGAIKKITTKVNVSIPDAANPFNNINPRQGRTR